MSKDNLQEFFFFIAKYPIPYATYRRFRKTDMKKTQDQINRQYGNNLKWQQLILKKLIQQSHRTASLIKSQSKMNKKKIKGLDKWT